MTTIIELILNAAFTGIGVAFGNEVYSWFKERRSKIKKKVQDFSRYELKIK